MNIRFYFILFVLFLNACSFWSTKPIPPAEPVSPPPAPVVTPAAPPVTKAPEAAKTEVPKIADYSLLKSAQWSDLDGIAKDDVTKAWPAWVLGCSALKAKPAWQAVCTEA